jgi:hypothetical protein
MIDNQAEKLINTQFSLAPQIHKRVCPNEQIIELTPEEIRDHVRIIKRSRTSLICDRME